MKYIPVPYMYMSTFDCIYTFERGSRPNERNIFHAEAQSERVQLLPFVFLEILGILGKPKFQMLSTDCPPLGTRNHEISFRNDRNLSIA